MNEAEKSGMYQEVNNLIYRIRTRFPYFLFRDESKDKDCKRLIELLTSDAQKGVVELFRDDKLNTHLANLMTVDCLLDEQVCMVGLKSNVFETIKDNPNYSDEEKMKYRLSNTERIIFGSKYSSSNQEAFGYVNGYKIKGAMFELIEHTKKLADIFGLEIPFKHTKFLDNLIFNYFKVYRGWTVRFFAQNFLSDKRTIAYQNGERKEVEYPIEAKRADLAYYLFNNPSEEERKTQEVYFQGFSSK